MTTRAKLPSARLTSADSYKACCYFNDNSTKGLTTNKNKLFSTRGSLKGGIFSSLVGSMLVKQAPVSPGGDVSSPTAMTGSLYVLQTLEYFFFFWHTRTIQAKKMHNPPCMHACLAQCPRNNWRQGPLHFHKRPHMSAVQRLYAKQPN